MILLTTNDVAKLLKIAPSTVYKYAESGKIAYMKIGSCLRFTPEHIEDYLQSCEKKVIRLNESKTSLSS